MNNTFPTNLRIFVSHSSADDEFSIKLVQDLRRVLRDDDTVWQDVSGGLHGGDAWWRKIVGQLERCNVFIVVLSPDASASHWVNAEIDIAWRMRISKGDKYIIPLIYRPCDIRADIDTLQMISFLPPKSYRSAFNELLMALKSIASQREEKDTIPLPPKAQTPVRNKQAFPRGKILLYGLLLLLVVGSATSFFYFKYHVPANALASQQVYRGSFLNTSLITTLDPAMTEDLNSASVINMVFTGLVELDDKLNIKPQLASSWDMASDGLTWTFHLKSNLKFSDGAPLTSKDVAYSIDRALQPSTHSPICLGYLGIIKDSEKLHAGQIPTIIGDSIFTLDQNTVILKTNKSVPYFLDTLSYPCSFVVEQRLVDKYGANFTDHLNEGGGAGPFIVSKYIHKAEIDFEPNRNYYGSKPQLRKINFFFSKNAQQYYEDYLGGRLDMADLTIDLLPKARKIPEEFHQLPELVTDFIAMNYLVKPFDNIHIRQAFSLAVNRDYITHTIWLDSHLPTYHIIPSGMLGYNPNLTGPVGVTDTRGNLHLAKQLLEEGLQEEGWSSIAQFPAIKLTYSNPLNDSAVLNKVTALVQMWRNAFGITIQSNLVRFATLLKEMGSTSNNPHGLQLWATGWIADYPDPQDWTTLQFSNNSPFNDVNYGQNTSTDFSKQRQVQQMLEAADDDQDQATRLQIYNKAEQQLVDDVAWMPIDQQTRIFMLKPYVQGLVFNAMDLMPPDDWANVYIAPH